MKELWVPAEQDVIVRLHSNGEVKVWQDVSMVKRPVGGHRKAGFIGTTVEERWKELGVDG